VHKVLEKRKNKKEINSREWPRERGKNSDVERERGKW